MNTPQQKFQQLFEEMQKTRKCSKCKQVFPQTLEYFEKNTSTNTGGDKYLRPECRSCSREASRNLAKAKKLVGNPPPPPPGSCCDRCGRDPGPRYSKKFKMEISDLVFDHCHKTLAHRGWLCDNCNRSMGMLGDDIEGMILSAVYIAKTTNVDKNIVEQTLNKLWD